LAKEGECEGMTKVDNFYRYKNEASLQQYRERIKDESRQKKEEQKKIKMFEKELRAMNKTVDLKKRYLNQVET
jgi:hypothetical protein